MITHEINRPKPLLPISRIQHVREVVANVLAGRNPQQALQQQNPQFLERVQGAGCTYMGKTGYAMWIEDEVKARFKKDMYVTLRRTAYIPDKIPGPLFRVADIQEVNWMAPINNTWNEPEALYIQHVNNRFCKWWCPAAVRPLNEEEMKLVDARNKESTLEHSGEAALAAEATERTSGADLPNEQQNDSYSG